MATNMSPVRTQLAGHGNSGKYKHVLKLQCRACAQPACSRQSQSHWAPRRRHNIPTSFGDDVGKFTCMQPVQRCVLLSLSLLGQRAMEHPLDNSRVVERVFQNAAFQC